MAILALAAKTHVTNPGFFQSHYDKLYKKYRLLLRYPKVKLLWWDTDYDTHRAAIHLHILWRLTGDHIYAEGLKRLHRITKAENNAWVQALCWPCVPTSEVDLSILQTFNFQKRVRGTLESINSTTGTPTVKWGDKVRSQIALPIAFRGSQDFYWQRNMFSLDEWVGSTVAGIHHCGLDFLLVFWLAARQGFLAQCSQTPPTHE